MFDAADDPAKRGTPYADQPEVDPKIAHLSSRRGVDLRSLPPGTELVVDTRNSRYRLVMLEDGLNALVQGGPYFAQETVARVEGSILRGSLLKIGWIGLGLCLEISACGQRIVTSCVRSIRIANSLASVPEKLWVASASANGVESRMTSASTAPTGRHCLSERRGINEQA
jgi:hypothetical protein